MGIPINRASNVQDSSAWFMKARLSPARNNMVFPRLDRSTADSAAPTPPSSGTSSDKATAPNKPYSFPDPTIKDWFSEEATPTFFRERPTVLAIMGITGCGKSSIINQCFKSERRLNFVRPLKMGYSGPQTSESAFDQEMRVPSACLSFVSFWNNPAPLNPGSRATSENTDTWQDRWRSLTWGRYQDRSSSHEVSPPRLKLYKCTDAACVFYDTSWSSRHSWARHIKDPDSFHDPVEDKHNMKSDSTVVDDPMCGSLPVAMIVAARKSYDGLLTTSHASDLRQIDPG